MKMKKKSAGWFVLGFLGGLIFAVAANAGVQFLPAAMSGSSASSSSQGLRSSSSCTGYSSQARQGAGWDCVTCNNKGVTKYKCKKKSCPSGYSTSRKSCQTETGGYSGDLACTRCVD